jgi:hypothetical protein
MRFSIRDLFWVTFVVAMAVSWWLDHRRLTVRGLELDIKAEIATRENAQLRRWLGAKVMDKSPR